MEIALRILQQEEALCLELGDKDSLQRSYGNQALILQAWGRLEDAMALLKKEEALCLELGNKVCKLPAEAVFMSFLGFYRGCAIQGSNSVPSVDNQELARQDSQRDSQEPLCAFNDDLKAVIKAWEMLGNTRLPMQIDIGFTDVITPEPAAIVYPAILGHPAPELRAYNRETVIAEKFEAMVKLGELNSRMPHLAGIADWNL